MQQQPAATTTTIIIIIMIIIIIFADHNHEKNNWNRMKTLVHDSKSNSTQVRILGMNKAKKKVY